MCKGVVRNCAFLLFLFPIQNLLGTARSVLHCGKHCTSDGVKCNAFHYNRTDNVCKVGKVLMLETPVLEDDQFKFYVKVSALNSIFMKCNGQNSCCDKQYGSQGCDEGEGDCDDDNDCSSPLVCGNNNCLKYHPEGGHWDAEDDCCERICRPDNICQEGGGTCKYDEDCSPSTMCGVNTCTNTTILPYSSYPMNSKYFGSNSSCCYRPCNSRYNLCGHNEKGCLYDADCKTGYYCKWTDTKNYCEDIDECQTSSGKAYCGLNTECTNTIGSYTCTCKSGYQLWYANQGCTDYNECSYYYIYCGYVLKCINYAGGYQCVCQPGYYKSGSTCLDINECAFDSVLESYPTEDKPGCWNKAGSYSCMNNVVLFTTGPYDSWYMGSIGIWNYELRKFQGLCAVGWGKETANVMCKQMGYVRGILRSGYYYYGSVDGTNFYASDVNCAAAGVYCYSY